MPDLSLPAAVSPVSLPDIGRRCLPLASAVLVAALLSACAERHHIIVGSVPDDYRTNHPIVISEQEQVLDLPVAAGARSITVSQANAVEGFFAKYDRRAASVVTILTPSGSANEAAATRVAEQIAHLLPKLGVERGRVSILPYQATSIDSSPPIRLSYGAMRAAAGPCGRWPGDLMDTSENKHYADFGCSYQRNFAAQVANPADLLGPRAPGEIDAERRGVVIDDYRNSIPNGFGEVEY